MNFVAWDRVVSLYPRGTFEHRQTLVTWTGASRFQRAMRKYIDRGFRISERAWTRQLGHLNFPLGGRWVGDTHTWTVMLGTSNINPPAPGTAWEPNLNSWLLGPQAGSDEPHRFLVRAKHIRSAILRHRYCATPRFRAFLLPRLMEQSNAEIMPGHFEDLAATEIEHGDDY